MLRRLLRLTTALSIALLVCHACASRLPNWQRFREGDLAGFFESPLEHIIEEMPTEIEVRNVAGAVRSFAGDWPGAAIVVFEVRGPEPSSSVRSTLTDRSGRFSISHVRPGRYRFKVTSPGWQSVMGTIVVAERADPRKRIEIVLPLGV